MISAQRLGPNGEPGCIPGLGRSEVVTAVEHVADDGLVRILTSIPARSWWGRVRGRRATRCLHAWIDDGADRLTMQEWTGEGEPLPCLRRSAMATISLTGAAT